MSFDTLPLELQNIVLANHSYMTKWFVFLLLLFLSAFYIWGIWPTHKKTIYFTQASLRLFTFALSVIYITTSPLMIINMSPAYSFYDWYVLPLTFYSIIMSIIFFLFIIDFFTWGMMYILSKAGLDFTNGRVKEIVNIIENNQHFLKFNMKRGK